MTTWLTPTIRRWLYSIGAAALTVLGIYGLIDGIQAAAWSGLLAALFGLAIANVNDTDVDS